MSEASLVLPVLWRDEHLVAIDKPSGWLVHRTGLDAHETRIVLQALRDQLGRPVYPVHRLDKGTSGVLLMALDPDTARAVAGQFEARALGKRYLALVRGWPPEAWTVDHALRPDDAAPETPAQPALTRFQRLASLTIDVPVDRYPTTRAALVQAWPETGRRHQIRRHLKHVAHPIIGDATHGKGAHNRWWAQRLGTARLWLHACELSLVHPWSGQPLTIVSDPIAGPDAARHGDWLALLRSQAWQWTSLQP